jgi:hypothetical protein
MFPSTRYEYDSNHDAQKKKRDISETSQLRKYHVLIIQPAVNRRYQEQKFPQTKTQDEFSTSNEGVRIIPQVVAENPPDASWPRAVDHSYHRT